MKRHVCRYCRKPTQSVVSFGNIPLVNYFPGQGEAAEVKRYPLVLYYCPSCKLGQTGVTVPPEDIFPLYHYVTGSSLPLVTHLTKLAAMVEKNKYLQKNASVLDIGCNDGSLLSVFAKKGYRVLGVDPAKNIATLAKSRGIPVITDFFGENLAKKIRETHGQFQIIMITHTLANIPDLRDFLRGVVLLLTPGGTLIIEVASWEDMVDRGQIDAVYHEHYYYFSESSLVRILNQSGLVVTHMIRNPAQGGSTQVIATPGNIQKRIPLRQVSAQKLATLAKRSSAYRVKLRGLIRKYRNKTVIGFGAPAKAVTLLNWAGITAKDITFVVDSTPVKQGRVLPGVNIPIYPEEYVKGKHIDAVVLLAWNYRDEILKKIFKLIGRSTSVITPFPRLKVVEL
ncbi:MAG: class I SAM-dependent methyltransferase [Patescibacteria group bacterium]